MSRSIVCAGGATFYHATLSERDEQFDVVTPFMSGQMSLADALQTREKQAQEVMDRYLA